MREEKLLLLLISRLAPAAVTDARAARMLAQARHDLELLRREPALYRNRRLPPPAHLVPALRRWKDFLRSQPQPVTETGESYDAYGTD